MGEKKSSQDHDIKSQSKTGNNFTDGYYDKNNINQLSTLLSR